MKDLLFALIAICLSCNSAKNNSSEDKGKYFVSIYTSIGDFKGHGKEFSDKCTAILNNIVEDKFNATDTDGLALLLENARVSLKSSFEDISKLQEVDTAIDLKSKCIAYLQESKNYYDNYYGKFLSLTKVPRNDDSLATLQMISKEIKLLKRKDSAVINAYQSFKEKYGIVVSN